MDSYLGGQRHRQHGILCNRIGVIELGDDSGSAVAEGYVSAAVQADEQVDGTMIYIHQWDLILLADLDLCCIIWENILFTRALEKLERCITRSYVLG